MITGGKVGMLYLLDRDNFGKFDPDKNNVVQEIEIPSDGDGDINKFGSGMYSVPAYFNGAVYYVRTGEFIKRVPIADAHLDDAHTQANDAVRFGFPGASPSLSADGSRNGIVWVTESYDPAGRNMRDHSSPGHLRVHAYDAQTLTELFNSGDTAPSVAGTPYRNFMKFVPPTITNGHVYVASGGQIQVYGLKTPALPADVTKSVKITFLPMRMLTAVGEEVQALTLTNTSGKTLPGPVSLVLDNLTPGASLTLTTGTGTTSYAKPSASFYANVGTLAPGKSAKVLLTFTLPAGPTSVTYRPRVLAGPGAR